MNAILIGSLNILHRSSAIAIVVVSIIAGYNGAIIPYLGWTGALVGGIVCPLVAALFCGFMILLLDMPYQHTKLIRMLS